MSSKTNPQKKRAASPISRQNTRFPVCYKRSVPLHPFRVQPNLKPTNVARDKTRDFLYGKKRLRKKKPESLFFLSCYKSAVKGVLYQFCRDRSTYASAAVS